MKHAVRKKENVLPIMKENEINPFDFKKLENSVYNIALALESKPFYIACD